MAASRDLVDPTDPASLQPEQRRREVAAILAAGVMRMRHNRAVAPARVVRMRAGRGRGAESSSRPTAACMSQVSPESGESCLELSHRGSSDGQRG